MTAPRHLTEAERHGVADGSLGPELEPALAEHLGACAACATDVARIRTLMTRIREAPPAVADPGGDLWPSIRARIEQDKISPLNAQASTRNGARPRFLWAVAGVAAALVITTGILFRRGQSTATPESTLPPGLTAVSIAESTSVYEEQARFLLNQLELRRALLRPQTASSIDHDLQVIDSAIAELKRAIERDPNNIALRALLASSYKQKVDLLKRVGNAG
jgi:anti-sigma factor RsiW